MFIWDNSTNYFIYNNLFLLFILSITTILLGLYLIRFIYIRGNEILNYLNINLLTIKTKSKRENIKRKIIILVFENLEKLLKVYLSKNHII